MALCVLLSIAPDLDFLFDWIFNLRGWHRGFTHSILFGALLGLAASPLLRPVNFRRTLTLVAVSISHGLLDAATTTQGAAVKLLWPFSDRGFKFRLFRFLEYLPNPGEDPFREVVVQALIISAKELLIFTPPLLGILYLKHRLRDS